MHLANPTREAQTLDFLQRAEQGQVRFSNATGTTLSLTTGVANVRTGSTGLKTRN